MDENDKLTDVEKFKFDFDIILNEYSGRLSSCYQDLLIMYDVRCQHEAYIRFEECICKIKKIFNDIELKTELRKAKSALSALTFEIEKMDCEVSQDKKNIIIDEVREQLDYINILLSQNEKAVCEEIIRILEKIEKCPYGEGENRSLNAAEFEKNVVEILRWLFIDDLVLSKDDEDNGIKEILLKRDGIFRISDNFDFSRCGLSGINPKFMILECKNYCKPSYRDLMQVFAYTIMSKITRTCDKPLCCIVSRENPDFSSMAMKMRDQLYSSNETLIIFLSVKDLIEMMEMRRKGDPFGVIKKSIEVMEHRNLKRES